MKYHVHCIRKDDYNIEFDENIWTEEEIEKWGEVFFDTDLEGLAEHLSFLIMRFGENQFYEGFGYVKKYDKDGKFIPQYKFFGADYKEVPEEDYANGVKLHVVSHEEEYEFEVTKV